MDVRSRSALVRGEQDTRIISARGLVMRFVSGARALTVLDGVDLDVAAGEFLAVTGPSGSGKSTLLGLVAGLDQPTAGRVVVRDVDLTRLDEDALARFRLATIGYVFQSFHLIPTLTAAENVAVPLELAGSADALGRAAALLDQVGLTDRASHYPSQLSGGEQQRVALARAVALDPPLLLADEPTGNLDSETGGRIIDLLLRLRAERDATLVMVTHDPALARHADRVVTIRDGRVLDGLRTWGASTGPPSPPRSERLGGPVALLDHPIRSQPLMSEGPRHGPPLPDPPFAGPGVNPGPARPCDSVTTPERAGPRPDAPGARSRP